VNWWRTVRSCRCAQPFGRFNSSSGHASINSLIPAIGSHRSIPMRPWAATEPWSLTLLHAMTGTLSSSPTTEQI